MRSKFKWIYTLLLAFSMQFSFAQEKTISGTVTEAGLPLPGVNVIVKGTTRGTQTDFDGKYSIKAKAGEVLEFSFLGMKTKTATVGAANTINMVMEEDKEGVKLGEVVLEGYKESTSEKTNTASQTLTAKAIENRPNVSFVQSLQGQVAGLNINSNSGSPGSAKIDVLLRGVGTINANTEPLFIIDGIPGGAQVFRSLNPEEIEAITVLKDAAATAIYGNRGSNGVLVVKTKRGKFNSKMKVRYLGTTGITQLQEENFRKANSQQQLTLERAVGRGRGANNPATGLPYTDQEIASEINVDWEKIFFRTGFTQNHNLSLEGGSNNLSNYTSLGYFEQDGIVPTTNFKRFTLRSNFTGKSDNEKFQYNTNLSLNYSRRQQLDQETRDDINGNVLQNPLQGYLNSLPYLDPAVYVNGQQLFEEFGAPSFDIIPYMLLDYIQPGNIPSRIDEIRLLANTNASYKLTKDLTFGSTIGLDYAQNNRIFARNPISYLAIVATPPGALFGGIETQSDERDFTFNATTRLTYSKTFKEKHTIDVNVFTEYVKLQRRFNGQTQTGLDPRTWAFGAGTGYIPFNPAEPTFYRPTLSASVRDAGLFSYFGSIDYDYDNKFGIGATFRRDASYKFVEDNKWGTFWSIAGRINLHNFKFMENSKFDMLKIRMSYGSVGNQNIVAAAPGFNPLYLAASNVRDLSSSQSGYGNAASLGVSNIANVDLQWEVTTTTNFGVDFSVFNKRFSGSVDYYIKETTQLFDTAPTSATLGTYGIAGNFGGIKNSGVELLLRYAVVKKDDFKLDVFFNGSYNKNEFTELFNGPRRRIGSDFIYAVGGQVDQYFQVPYAGVNPANGNLLFYDINNNLTENPTDADRRDTDKTRVPVYQGGFGFDMTYKGFFLNTQFSFVADVHRFDSDLAGMMDSSPNGLGTFPVSSDLLGAWTPTNTSSNIPALNASNFAAGDLSDRFLRDASFLRLRNIQFGYNVPSSFLKKSFIEQVRIFSQIENLVTWTKWRGFDPESSEVSTFGGYPNPRIISVGLELQF